MRNQEYLKRNGIQTKFYQKQDSYSSLVHLEIEGIQVSEWINVIAERKDNG